MILSDTLSGLASRFRLIVDGLRKTVPEHQTKNPASCALVGVIWTSLGRRLERFGRILARVQAGIPDPVRPSRGGRTPTSREADAATDPTPSRKLRLPTRVGWLMIMMPWVVAPYGSQLRHWLTDPDAEALVRSSRRMRRLLRPLLRSLSTDPLPDCLMEPAPENAAGETLAIEGNAAVPRPRKAARRGIARQTRRAPDAADAAAACDVQASPAGSAPLARYGFRSAPVEPPRLDWWSVQDERRRAALAIARGSVCRG